MNTNKATDEVADVAEEKAVETETTQTESPQVESPITGDETTGKESDDQGSLTEESDVESTMTLEQRRAFQEMRLENKRLKEERESGQNQESAFDLFRPKNPPMGQSEQIRIENYQDPVTGETNWQAYNYDLQQREQKILQTARFEAQQAVKEELDEQSARTQYPDLFADKTTEKMIASRWFYDKAQGLNPSITQIAGEFARNFKQAVSKAEKIGAERVLNEVTEKEKAGLSAQTLSSQSGAMSSEEDLAQLSARTRGGDDEAITARISKIPWANK